MLRAEPISFNSPRLTGQHSETRQPILTFYLAEIGTAVLLSFFFPHWVCVQRLSPGRPVKPLSVLSRLLCLSTEQDQHASGTKLLTATSWQPQPKSLSPSLFRQGLCKLETQVKHQMVWGFQDDRVSHRASDSSVCNLHGNHNFWCHNTDNISFGLIFISVFIL